jgi:hypothetical protein
MNPVGSSTGGQRPTSALASSIGSMLIFRFHHLRQSGLLQAATTYPPCKLRLTSPLTLHLTNMSSISASMGKPNSLPFNGYIVESARSLATAAEFESDTSIPYLIRYQQILDEVRDVYSNEQRFESQSRIHLHANRLTLTFVDWWSSVPPAIRQSRA